MANYKRKIVKISKGQISPSLVERTDIGLLDSSGQRVSNFINSKYGLFSTMPGTVVKYSFGANKTVRLFLLNLLDGTDCFLAINATDKQLSIHNHQGVKISSTFSIPNDINLSADTLNLIKVAQNNELILIASPNNPLLQLVIDTSGDIESLARFEISTENILKSSVFVSAAVDPVVVRIASAELPETPENIGIAINDVVILSQSGNPNTTFPWSGYKFLGYETTTEENEDGETITTTKAKFESVQYTPVVGDYCYDEFDNSYWLYVNNVWTRVNQNTVDTTYNVGYKVNATSGRVDATGFTITITKPGSYSGTPEEYAKKLLIGCDFDGNNGLGLFRITNVSGNTSGNNYNITKISGMTYVSFLKADTTYQGFTITTSMRPAFDSNRPGTIDNLYNTTNYPLNIFFYQQRLYITGTTNNPTQLLVSNTGKYNDFSDDYSGASTNSFQLIISGTEKETIQNVLLNQGLQIFTDKGEWVISDAAITKDSGFVRNSTIGSSYVQPVISANGITLFCPKQGAGIVGFIYNQDNASFNTPYISLLTDIFDAPVANMCLKKGYTTSDDTLIYMPLTNGRLVIANYLQDQEIQAFVSRDADDVKFLQALQVENDVLLLVNRFGNIQIELQDLSKNTSASSTDFVYTPETGIISNLPTQYNNRPVNIYDDTGKFIDEVAPTNGTIQLAAPYPTGISEVGFNIHSKFISNPQNINQETYSIYKTIRTIKLALTDSSKADYLTVNGKYGRNKDNFITYIRPTKPSRECTFVIENDRYKLDIMSIEIDLEA